MISMVPRLLLNEMCAKILSSGKVVILFGARQTGKTTLCNQVIEKLGLRTFMVNADQAKYLAVFSGKDLDRMLSLTEGYEMLFIDEAHRIPDIGLNIKILHDEVPGLKILLTGSSSFELSQKVTEPLTGRKHVYQLYPVATCELSSYMNAFEINETLEDTLIYGSYPEVFTAKNHQDKTEILEEITNSYLFKDVLETTTIRYRFLLRDLLKLIAFQIGSEVSLHELSKSLGISRETVENYLRLMEESFIIYRLSGFSRNLRKEISKLDKFYFYDLGIRNCLINNLNPLDTRNDHGQLWENFIITERLKYISYKKMKSSAYFWRTYTGAELDYVEEREGKLFGYEIKYKKDKARIPNAWKETYGGEYQLINKSNYLSFMT